jgi:hypothetical protein
VAPQNARIVTTAAARDVRGESDGDDSKDMHSGKLAPPAASPNIPVIVAVIPVILISIPTMIAILGLVAIAALSLTRLRPEPRIFRLTRTDLLVAKQLALARHLELTLALDLQLALACDLEFALPTDLVLVDPIVVVVAVVAADALTIDQVSVCRHTPGRGLAVHWRGLTARRNTVDPDPAHARGRHLARRNPENALGQYRGREGERRRGR